VFQKMEGIEKGKVTDFNTSNGTVTATLLGAGQIVVPYIGYPPGRGQSAWFMEIASGSLVCLGAVTQPGWAGPWNAPWGIMGTPAVITASVANGTGVVTVAGMSVTYTAVANRRVRMTAQVRNVIQAGAGSSELLLANGTSSIADTLAGLAAGSQPIGTITAEDSPAAGSVTYNVRTSTSATTATVFANNTGSPAFSIVEDIGPNGDPPSTN
jgi:hypothetical protein